MGTIHSHGMNPYVEAEPSIRISGGTGDGLCRAEFGQHFFGKVGGQSETVDDIVDWCEWWNAPYKIIGDEQSHSRASDVLKDELDSMVGGSCLEKMGLTYLCFRNSYHFDPYLEMRANNLVWMPLQSRTLLLLNHLTHDSFRGIKLETDLITTANPMCMAVPFEKQMDNDMCLRNQAVFREIPSWVESMRLPDGLEMISERESANARAKTRLLNKKDPRFDDPARLLDETLARMGSLARKYEDVLGSEVLYALFHYYEINKDNKSRIGQLNHKLTSILDQLFLIGG